MKIGDDAWWKNTYVLFVGIYDPAEGDPDGSIAGNFL